MAYDIITITPTLDTSAYVNSDVLFTGTEVKLPSSSCKILSASAIWNDPASIGSASGDQLPGAEFLLYFFQNNTHAMGTINTDSSDASRITAAQIATNVFLGAVRLVNNTSSGEADLGDPTLFASQHVNDNAVSSTSGFEEIVLESGATKDTVYVQSILEIDPDADSAGDGLLTAADGLTITLCVEY